MKRGWSTGLLAWIVVFLLGCDDKTVEPEIPDEPEDPIPAGFVNVPAGSFTMGSDPGEGYFDEEPEHAPTLARFFISAHEVSNGEFARLLNQALAGSLLHVVDTDSISAGRMARSIRVYLRDATGPLLAEACVSDIGLPTTAICFESDSFAVVTGDEDVPVTDVTWFGGAAYCNWQSTADGRTPCYDETSWSCDLSVDGFQLPTEAEWEKACRGDDERIYATGDSVGCAQVNWMDCGRRPLGPSEVLDEAFMSPYGAVHMSGNVWEWCNDWYDAEYYATSSGIDPTGPSSGDRRVARGGSWRNVLYFARCAARLDLDPTGAHDNVGFRMVTRAAEPFEESGERSFMPPP